MEKKIIEKEIIEKENKGYIKPNMDSFTTCRNLCNWSLYFSLPSVLGGEKTIKSNGTIDLLNREIKLLCDNNDIFFIGTGEGNHARIFVDDENMRVYLGFESEDGKRKQNIISDEKCQKLFDYKTHSTFEKHINEDIITEHEKDFIMSYARKNKINDFEKIDFLENFCNKKFKI